MKTTLTLQEKEFLASLPTEFYGCWWDADWEFDAPAIVYYPFKKYGFGSALEIDQLVEDVCIDICLGEQPRTKFTESELSEFKWRRWNPKGFAKRKNAIHRRITVKWFYQQDGELMFDFIKEEQSEGPF